MSELREGRVVSQASHPSVRLGNRDQYNVDLGSKPAIIVMEPDSGGLKPYIKVVDWGGETRLINPSHLESITLEREDQP